MLEAPSKHYAITSLLKGYYLFILVIYQFCQKTGSYKRTSLQTYFPQTYFPQKDSTYNTPTPKTKTIRTLTHKNNKHTQQSTY